MFTIDAVHRANAHAEQLDAVRLLLTRLLAPMLCHVSTCSWNKLTNPVEST
jgi:hypothetical protein